MRIQIVLSLAIVLSACNNADKSKLASESTAVVHHKDSTKKIKNDTTIKVNVDSQIDSSSKILGIWLLKGESNPTFEIRKSTIYYPEHFKSYKYKVAGDSLKIFYDDFNETFAFKLKGNDTLTLTGEDGVTEYYKVKK